MIYVQCPILASSTSVFLLQLLVKPSLLKTLLTALDIFAFLCQKFGWLGPGRWWSLPSKFITSEPDVLLIIKITKHQNCLIVTTVPGISFQSASKVYMDSQGLHGDM